MISTATTQKKQTQILSVARELFLERGYDAVSLDDILERVGGSKTTLYSYYGGKEGLFSAMVHQLCKEKLGALLAMDVTEMDPFGGLNAIGGVFLRTVFQADGIAVFRAMIAEAQRFPTLTEAFYRAGPQMMLNSLKRNIEHWQTKGMLREGNAEVLASQFLGIMMADFNTKSVLGLCESLSDAQITALVDQGTELFLRGALPLGPQRSNP